MVGVFSVAQASHGTRQDVYICMRLIYIVTRFTQPPLNDLILIHSLPRPPTVNFIITL